VLMDTDGTAPCLTKNDALYVITVTWSAVSQTWQFLTDIDYSTARNLQRHIFGPGRQVPKSHSSFCCSCCCWDGFSKNP